MDAPAGILLPSSTCGHALHYHASLPTHTAAIFACTSKHSLDWSLAAFSVIDADAACRTPARMVGFSLAPPSTAATRTALACALRAAGGAHRAPRRAYPATPPGLFPHTHSISWSAATYTLPWHFHPGLQGLFDAYAFAYFARAPWVCGRWRSSPGCLVATHLTWAAHTTVLSGPFATNAQACMFWLTAYRHARQNARRCAFSSPSPNCAATCAMAFVTRQVCVALDCPVRCLSTRRWRSSLSASSRSTSASAARAGTYNVTVTRPAVGRTVGQRTQDPTYHPPHITFGTVRKEKFLVWHPAKHSTYQTGRPA